jgi:hypothetical protein
MRQQTNVNGNAFRKFFSTGRWCCTSKDFKNKIKPNKYINKNEWMNEWMNEWLNK